MLMGSNCYTLWSSVFSSLAAGSAVVTVLLLALSHQNGRHSFRVTRLTWIEGNVHDHSSSSMCACLLGGFGLTSSGQSRLS